MTREIKFRAWDEESETWAWVDDDEVTNGVLEDNPLDATWYIKTPKNTILMQYTGLKDKNGKEIYCGDIFNLGDKNIKYVVEWHDCGFSGRQIENQSRVGLVYWNERIEVMGNIYEDL